MIMPEHLKKSISIPADLVEKIEGYCCEHNRSFSYVMRQSVLYWLSNGAPLVPQSRKGSVR